MLVFRYSKCVGALVLLSNLNDLKFFFQLVLGGANTHDIYSSSMDSKAFVPQTKTVVYCLPNKKKIIKKLLTILKY